MSKEIDLWVRVTFQVDPTTYPATSPQGEEPDELDVLLAPPADDGAEGLELAGAGTETKGLLGLPDIPIPIDPPSKRVVKGAIKNRTGKVLKLIGQPKIVSGTLVQPMPTEILEKSEDETFRAESKLPHTFAGAEGSASYAIDDQGTTWQIGWSIPAYLHGPSERNSATSTVTGPGKDNFHAIRNFGMEAQDDFTYVLQEKGGGDKPDGAISSSCLITVTNNTKQPLKRIDQKHEHGNFLTQPPTALAPGASATFSSVETPGAKKGDQGCKGFIVWEIGTPATATWKVEWDNPEQQTNTAAGSIDPTVPGLSSLADVGQGDENVPFVFTLSGEGTGPQGKDPPFEPPEKPKQPTLRQEDNKPDGWVEYAQELLNFHLKTNLKIDGKFGPGTLKAVKAFQHMKKLTFEDGIVGDETWAALREGAPEKPATDGRKPHSFEEKGAQARFTTEKPHNCHFFTGANQLQMRVVAVGEQSIEGAKAIVQVVRPDGSKKTREAAVGKMDGPTPDGQGQLHTVLIEKFTEVFGVQAADVSKCVVDAYLDKAIGGDRLTTNPQVDP